MTQRIAFGSRDALKVLQRDAVYHLKEEARNKHISRRVKALNDDIDYIEKEIAGIVSEMEHTECVGTYDELEDECREKEAELQTLVDERERLNAERIRT